MNKPTLPLEQQIDEIMDNFDFERVHKTMVALHWPWGTPGEVPEPYQIRKKAREMLREIVSSRFAASETGGFRATLDGDVLGLAFIVESWEVDYDLD